MGRSWQFCPFVRLSVGLSVCVVNPIENCEHELPTLCLCALQWFSTSNTHTHTTLASSWRESPVTRQTENNKKKRWGQLSQFQGGGGGGRKGGWCAVTVIWSRPLPHVFNCGNFKPPTSHTLTSLSNIVHTHAHTRDDIIQRRRWRKKKKMREKDK